MRGAEPVTFRVTGMDTLVRTQFHITGVPRRVLALSVLISTVVVFGCAGGSQKSSSAPVTYTIGGTISGLSGTGLVLKDDNANYLSVSAGATSFTFTTVIASGDAYSVTVSSQPSSPPQTCTVSNGSGTVASANVTSVAVSCIAFSGGFVLTGSMTSARPNSTATLLNNGQVLKAGGENGTDYLSSAELYDTATGTFTATGSMTTARFFPTATLLNNGQVLIAGGGNATGSVASAELYDPTTGTFTSTGNMTTARVYQTATLLNNGQVLIAGGESATGTVASAELYDPATGTFTSTGNMTTAREYYTATLLNNGRVLITGGGNDTPYVVTSAELYNPATGTFASTGNMTSARSGQTATLLNSGQVLIAGGGNDKDDVVASAEL